MTYSQEPEQPATNGDSSDFNFAAITVRRHENDSVIVNFSEDIAGDVDTIAEGDEIPVEYLAAVLSRSALAKKRAALAGCERCSKDCFW